MNPQHFNDGELQPSQWEEEGAVAASLTTKTRVETSDEGFVRMYF